MSENNKNLIAVYGSLRGGLGNHRLIANSTYVGTCETEAEYSLYDLGYYPGLKKNGNTAVTIEIYEVDNAIANSVDRLEGYSPDRESTFYDKEFIDTPFGKAGIYIYVPSVREDHLVESGDWKSYLEERKKQFLSA